MSAAFSNTSNKLSNPFGDPANILGKNATHSSFEDSFDRAFENVPPIGQIDTFAALAFSSPTSQNNRSSANDSANRTDLSGINFSALASLASDEQITKIATSSDIPNSPNGSVATTSACKPNYHAFYTLSEVTTPIHVDKSTAEERKLPASSLDIFQSVAASAFQHFGNATPTGIGFAKRTNPVEMTSTTQQMTMATPTTTTGPGPSTMPFAFGAKNDLNNFATMPTMLKTKDSTIGNIFGDGVKVGAVVLAVRVFCDVVLSPNPPPNNPYRPV